MAPVFHVARRGVLDDAFWRAWFEQLAADPGDVSSLRGLARRHNLGAFLQALYVAVRESADGPQHRMLPALVRALKAVN